MKKFHVAPVFDVRWRLEYHDGTNPKWGQWSRPEIDIKSMACFKRREGLARAFIETRNKRTFETAVPVHCAAHDFVMFKWECAASIAGCIGSDSLKKPVTPNTQIIGLKLITRDLIATVRVDGSEPIIQRRSEKEKKIHYEGFGR